MVDIQLLVAKTRELEGCCKYTNQSRFNRQGTYNTSYKSTGSSSQRDRKHSRKVESPTIRELAVYCASTLLQRHVRGFLQRLHNKVAANQKPSSTYSYSNESTTQTESPARLEKFNIQTDGLRPKFIEKLLNHFDSKSWQLNYDDLLHLLKATETTNPQGHENLSLSNLDVGFDINYCFEVRLLSNAVAFQSDLIQALYTIKKRVDCIDALTLSEAVDDPYIFSDNKTRFFREIQRKYEIPSKAIRILLDHEMIDEYTPDIIEIFLTALNVGFSESCKASLKTTLELKMKENINIFSKLKLRVAHYLIHALSIWESSSYNDACILVAEMQDKFQILYDRVDQACVVIHDQKKMIIRNSNYDTPAQLNCAETRLNEETSTLAPKSQTKCGQPIKSSEKPHHENKSVLVTKQSHQYDTSRSIPKLSKVDITFGRYDDKAHDKSIKSSSESNRKRFKKNIRISSNNKKSIAETVQQSKQKRDFTVFVPSTNTPMQNEDIKDMNSEKSIDIYKNASLKLNSILEKFNSKFFDNVSNIESKY